MILCFNRFSFKFIFIFGFLFFNLSYVMDKLPIIDINKKIIDINKKKIKEDWYKIGLFFLSKQIKNANRICSSNSSSKNTIECINIWKTIDHQALLYIEQHYYTEHAIQEIFKLYND